MEMNRKFTPDALIVMILATQEDRDPDSDPGDITIKIQDDMPLVGVYQKGEALAYGNSIQDALERAWTSVQNLS